MRKSSSFSDLNSRERTAENIKHLQPPHESPFTSNFNQNSELSNQCMEQEEESANFENKFPSRANSGKESPDSKRKKSQYEKWMTLISSRNLDPSAKKQCYSPDANLTES